MKALYEGITDILTNDSDLRKMVGYSEKNRNIRRGYQPTGTWKRMVVFYLQPESVIDFTVSSRIRMLPLIIRVYDRENDMNTDDMAERIILLLDGADLGVVGEVFCYGCDYTGEITETVEALNYDATLQSYLKILRFEVRFRVDAVIGTTGRPTRRRKRESI